MKSIESKYYDLWKNNDRMISKSTKELIEELVDFSGTGKRTLTTTEIRKRNKFLDRIEDSLLKNKGEKINVEETDYKFIQDLMEEMPWSRGSRGIDQFIKDIDAVEKQDKEE